MRKKRRKKHQEGMVPSSDSKRRRMRTGISGEPWGTIATGKWETEPRRREKEELNREGKRNCEKEVLHGRQGRIKMKWKE